MNGGLYDRYFEVIKVAIDDPTFYQRTFSLIAKQRKKHLKHDDDIKCIVEDELDLLSRSQGRAKIQDGAAMRSLIRIRKLVELLINDRGELDQGALSHAIEHVRHHLYSLGPGRQLDAKHHEQMLHAMVQLQDSKEMQILLKNVATPYMNRSAEQLIKDTLQLPANSRVNDPQAKRAALAAWFCLLRQSVGSCFGTAPAILVHDQQPALMFRDLVELFATGRLKRTYGGVEYSVPLSASWGAGDLRRPFILSMGPIASTAEIWASPGLLAALEAVGLVPENLSLKERIYHVRTLLLPFLNPESREARYAVFTIEELLKNLLLKTLKMAPEDLEEQVMIPQASFTGSVMMQVSASSGSKFHARANFYSKFESACTAFKAVADNALLKSWEFTIASFAETKTTFARWNLYSSLGLGPQEDGGIGDVIQARLQDKLDQLNRKIEDVKVDYEQSLSLLRYLETRMRTANSEKDAEWIKMEYRTRRYEFGVAEERYNHYQRLANRYSGLLNLLVNIYAELFPRYFQEVYDADMQEVTVGPYDDSPAGFRLLYKYGRANTAQWNRIQSPSDFIDALASFFISSESEVASQEEMEGLTEELSDLTTAIVMHIRTPGFLETAFYRMARAHRVAPIQNPLEHLDQIEKKPWAYTSGGTMESLVSCYWRREHRPTETGRWIENPTELLVFLVDTLKQMPSKITEEFEKDPKKSLLMHSPTHAFLLKPGLTLFKELWKSPQFTYTYIRDTIIQPAENFVSNIALDQFMGHYLVEKMADKVPINYQHYFRQVFSYVPVGISPIELRQHLVDVMEKERGLGFGKVLPSDEIDSLLFSLLPLFPATELKERVQKILKNLPNVGPSFMSKLETLWEELPIQMRADPIMNAQCLQDIVKAFLCLFYEKTSTPYDYHLYVSQACKKLGYAMPMPIIVADTNWAKDEFGFVLNPGTGKFEFWRVDYTGSMGYPLSIWNQWLDGSQRDSSWVVYSQPHEYAS